MTSAALLSHLSGEVLTVATLVTITRRDGQVYAFTDHDTAITFAGLTYQAGTYTPSAIASTSDLSVDNLEIESYLDASVITEADIIAGLWNYAAVQIEQVNYADLTQGSRPLRRGTLGEISLGRISYKAELRGLAQALQQTVGELSSTRCRADLGDARCGIDLTGYTVTGSITSVDADNRTLGDTSRTEAGPAGALTITGITKAQYAVVTLSSTVALTSGQTVMLSDVVGMTMQERINGQLVYGTASLNGTYTTIRSITDGTHLVLNLDTRNYSNYTSGGKLQFPGSVGTFDGGKITFTSGLNAGRSMEVKGYVPGLLVLALPMPYPVAVGDTYSLIPGCGKRVVEDCYTRYSNVVNFRGEPWRPGMDELLRAGGV